MANPAFGELVIRSLFAFGVKHVVLSPGSRSTPLALACAEYAADRMTVILDERSAAFYALGRIKATRRPVAVICTSGSAAAQYYPAVIEARESGLPLVVLTADRPPELRHGHAGQTIDQVKLYGNYPVFQAELPLPEASASLFRQVREICRLAVGCALGEPHGPVHLNCPFREPFFPGESTDSLLLDETLLDGLSPCGEISRGAVDTPALPERTLILAGPRPWKDPDGEVHALLDLACKGGYPVLADASNPLRYVEDGSVVVIHYDRVLRDPGRSRGLQPEAVLLWGEPPTSKVLRHWLAGLDVPGYRVGHGKRAMNPVFGKIAEGGGCVSSFCAAAEWKEGTFFREWKRLDAEMEAGLRTGLENPHSLFEGDVHRLLRKCLPEGAPVLFANSMAIRDAEWFIPAGGNRLDPFSQRGANGIDGTLSMARGIGDALNRPMCLVTGDLAFLHDVAGLRGTGGTRPGLLVLLVNNSGGGIFEFLPVAAKSPHFEACFATPQDVELHGLVAAHGGRHLKVASAEGLAKQLQEWSGEGLLVLEIPVDRKLSRDLHREFLDGFEQKNS